MNAAAPTAPSPYAPIPSDGERMVWQVPSERKASKLYRVDLLANGGYGECECPDWQARRGPAIRTQPPPPLGASETRCKHVTKVRHLFLNQLLAEMARQENADPATSP